MRPDLSNIIVQHMCRIAWKRAYEVARRRLPEKDPATGAGELWVDLLFSGRLLRASWARRGLGIFERLGSPMWCLMRITRKLVRRTDLPDIRMYFPDVICARAAA